MNASSSDAIEIKTIPRMWHFSIKYNTFYWKILIKLLIFATYFLMSLIWHHKT